MDVRRERRLSLGTVELAVTMPEPIAARISTSPAYRHVFRPAARWAYHSLPRRRGPRPDPALADAALVPATPPRPEDLDQEAIRLIQRIAGIDWYQTIDFGRGVESPGVVDLRREVDACGLPASLRGLRCLDVGTSDGFWAFEMERRGASEVVGVDVAAEAQDRPPIAPAPRPRGWLDSRAGGGFEAAAALLESRARRFELSVYELSPARTGRFDLVFVRDLLGSLRDPQRALEAIYSVSSGMIVLAEAYSRNLDGLRDLDGCHLPALAELEMEAPEFARWWRPNVAALKTMLTVAGYEPVEEVARLSADGPGGPSPFVVLRGHVPARHSWKAFTDPHGGDGRPVLRADELMPEPPRRARVWRLGSLEVGLSVPESEADRLTATAAYRAIVGPAVRLSGSRKNGSAAAAPASNGNGGRHAAPAPAPDTSDPAARSLLRRIEGINWYHTIDLGHGVSTPGFVDHREQVPLYRLPESLAGKRCLDVATFDGFWALEMEKRGAAEVVALDIERFLDVDMPRLLALDERVRRVNDAPVGTGFRTANRILHSKVKRHVCSVYDLSPDRVGEFDFVIMSDLLVHLRDPLLAMQNVASVCRGTFYFAEMFHPALEREDGVPVSQYAMRMPYAPDMEWELWWIHNSAALRRMLALAGFRDVEEMSRFELKARVRNCQKVVYRAAGPDRLTVEKVR